jgi:hypothetical protein
MGDAAAAARALSATRSESALAARASRARAERAAARAHDLIPFVLHARQEGAQTLRALADALNVRGIPTPSGRGHWRAEQVRRLLAR